MTVEIYNTASAGIVIGILILPLVTSMSEDALSAVPRSLREGAYAMGFAFFWTPLGAPSAPIAGPCARPIGALLSGEAWDESHR